MPRALPRHCYCERNRRSGAPMYYVRVGHGPRIRIKAAFGTSEFETEYATAVSGKAPPRKTGPTAGSLAWLIDRYREVNAWTSLSLATRRQRENIFKQIIATAGDKRYTSITHEAIAKGRDLGRIHRFRRGTS